MNISTSDIIFNVFEEFTPVIISLSSEPHKTEAMLKEMYGRLQDSLSTQYYNKVFKYVSSVDIDDMMASSPPKSNMIDKCSVVVNTPEKKR